MIWHNSTGNGVTKTTMWRWQIEEDEREHALVSLLALLQERLNDLLEILSLRRPLNESKFWTRYKTSCEEAEKKHAAHQQSLMAVRPPPPSSMLDMLPNDITQHKLVPFLGPNCSNCGQKLTFVDSSQHGRCNEEIESSTAFILEESLRENTLTDGYPQLWKIKDNHLFHVDPPPGEDCGGGFYDGIQLPHLFGSLNVKWENYLDTRDEVELLGEFRFCLVKLPVQNFQHYLQVEQTFFCSKCANEKQLKHCSQEIERIRSAREAEAIKWLAAQSESQPNYYKHCQTCEQTRQRKGVQHKRTCHHNWKQHNRGRKPFR